MLIPGKIQTFVAAAVLLCFAAIAHSEELGLADAGCPMAHCDASLSDLVIGSLPDAPVAELWRRDELPSERAGSANALGCTSNGFVAACTYRAGPDAMIVYGYEGARLWTSEAELNGVAYLCTPLFLNDGSIVSCDSQKIIRFDAFGEIVWRTLFPKSVVPISVVKTQNNVLIIGTLSGPIYAIDAEDGELVGVLEIRLASGAPGVFVTRNTAAVRENRVYLSMEFSFNANLGWLVAVDVADEPTEMSGRLRWVWRHRFGGRSGASPLVIGDVIYLDGDRLEPGSPLSPNIMGVRDLGDRAEELFKIEVDDVVRASMAQDPRGGFWVFSQGESQLTRREEETGQVLQVIGWASALRGMLPAGEYIPYSAMSVYGDESNPAMVVTALSTWGGTDYLIALDLIEGRLMWAVDQGDDRSLGQFPVVDGPFGSRIIYSSKQSGARAIGSPAVLVRP